MSAAVGFGHQQADVVADQIVLVVTEPVSYTHLRAHETVLDLVCRLLLENKNKHKQHTTYIVVI